MFHKKTEERRKIGGSVMGHALYTNVDNLCASFPIPTTRGIHIENTSRK